MLLFRYLAARWRYRRSPAKRYIQPGMALERRAQNLSVFWTEHFSRSRAAQARWAQVCRGDVLTVLGAGPLFDFNANALSQRFKRFRFVDANPLVVSHWGRLHTPVEAVVTDISGCLTEWSEAIGKFHGSWEQTLAFIRQLGQTPAEAYSPRTDGLLSLNILSQLDVGWQEIVEPALRKKFGQAFVRRHEQEWLDAVRPGSQSLAEQHLAALEASGATHVLLISDTEYVEYKGRQYSRQRHEPPPMTFTQEGWVAEPGIAYEITPGLEGVELNSSTLGRWMPSYRLDWQDGWLWHIAPSGTETNAYGKLHRVGAFCLVRYRDSVSG